MDKDFQTSFIPKKPMIEHRATSAKPVSMLTIISLFILFTAIVATGGLYFYRGVLTKNLSQMKASLESSKSRFEPSKINQLQVLDKRIRSASEILSKHITVSPIFEVLQSLTMKSVRYTKFSYEIGADDNSKIFVKMNGTAVGYRSIALQSDLFAKNKNIIDPVFSNLSLDDAGNVLFDLNFSVEPSFVNYKQALSLESASNGSENAN